MSDPDTKRSGFLAELKRRHVIPVALIYAAAGVALVEAADLFLPRLQAPDWTVTVLVVLVVAGFPVAIVLAWIYQITPAGLRRSEWLVGDAAESEWIPRVGVPGEDDGRRSIAVLPFADMSPDHDQEYFSDGMSEELINALTKLEDLRVAARTSAFAFKGKEQDVRAIGRKLGVETVLEGSVRKAENRLRITAQLINVADGYHLWSETYDRELEDVFAIQDEISRSIVGTLQLKLEVGAGESLAPASTQNMEAYDLYLKGRHHWYKRYKVGLQTALEYFQKAIASDPDFALPYTGVADAFMMMGTIGAIPPDKARAMAIPAAERALALDDRLAEAHFSMGAVRFFLQWDWEGAEEEYQRAIELNPYHAEAHVWWAILLAARGRVEEGLQLAEAASDMDPDSPYVATHVGQTRIWARRYEDAITGLEQVVRNEPEALTGFYHLANAYSGASRYEEAIAAFEKAVTLSQRSPALVGMLGATYGRMGRVREAQPLLDELLERSGHEYVSPAMLAMVLANVGQTEEAFRQLEAAADEVDPTLVSAVGSPLIDAIGPDRFGELRKRMGLEA